MWPFKRRKTWGVNAYSYPKIAKHGDRFKGKYGWRQFDEEFGWLPYRTCMKCDELRVGFTASMFELCPACQWGDLIKCKPSRPAIEEGE